MSEAGYLRQPTISGGAIVFVCDDDLWRVDAAGGVARRLTAGLGEPSTPALSPDGRWLAYVARDEQHPEVYLMAAEGGPARRMTWLGPDVMVRGFTPDGRILFVTTYGQPFFRNYRAFALATEGGLPELLPLGQVNHLSFGPGGARVIGRNTSDPARWKRYRGGTAGHLWADARGSGEFVRLSRLAGNITSPMWIGERIFYLSDAEGVGNLYSCRPDGSDVRRHSDHDDFYARHASTDGRRIVYQCGARLWLFDPAQNATREVKVDVPGHRTQAARKFVAAADFIDGIQVHPAGHSIAIEARGRLFSFALWEGAVHQHGSPAGARNRFGQWLADGRTLVAVSDASGEERVELIESGTPAQARSLSWDVGRVIAMRAAPRGSLVAIANHRNEVWIGDAQSGEFTRIDRSDSGRTEDLAWSPDGAWLAYSFWTTPRHCAIKLCEIKTRQATLVTQPEFRDWSPAFDPDGKYLYFISARTFDPVYDNVQFELSFPRAARPYLIALRADASPPFEPEPRGMKRVDPERPENNEAAAVKIDLPGIARRVAAFPVAEGRYGQIAGARGRALWTSLPIPGAHGRGGHKETPGRLESFDFNTLRTETIAERADSFEIAGDAATLILREGKRVRALDATKDRDHNGKSQATSDNEFSRSSGWVDLNRVRLSIEPRAEWRQMLREVWRLQRDQFWVEDMSGVDWNAVYQRYAPLLDRVSTRAELSDLIWELQGELGTSHAYESGGDHRRPPHIALGQLGADLRAAPDGGWEIVDIARGDPWESGADSPLNAVGVLAKPGERIVAVNGQPTTRELPPQALLVNQAGMKAELTLEAPGAGAGGRRNVLVTLLADEVPARYRAWVERNRAWVHDRSNGKVGYLHLPDMQSAGFAEFHRYFALECDRDALVVDLRYNRGGHVSQLLLEKVARRRIGYDLQRWGQPQPYPSESPAGPVVALTNEHAGSDGDIFSHCFKLMKIGPLVGKRTWGGVIGIWPRHKLVDGTETTQPEFSFWFQDVAWAVENYGTDPEIDVDNAPQDAATGRDRQLETALDVAVEKAAAAPPRPRFDGKPQLARKPLPPRG